MRVLLKQSLGVNFARLLMRLFDEKCNERAGMRPSDMPSERQMKASEPYETLHVDRCSVY
jgi:hypothetical protein